MSVKKISRIDWEITDAANWAEELAFFNDDDNSDYDALADLIIRFSVMDCGTQVLSASTEEGTITRPDDNKIAFNFTVEDLGGLCAGKTYELGCTAEDDDGLITQLFVGSVAVISGGFP